MDVLLRARDLYRAGRMHEALEAAQRACELHAKDPEAWWLLACVSRYTGLPGASEQAFRRAAELAPAKGMPFRVSPEHFRGLVSSAAGTARKGESVRVESLPAIEAIRAGLAPDAPASRVGATLVLYQFNLENLASSEEALKGIIEGSLASA